MGDFGRKASTSVPDRNGKRAYVKKKVVRPLFNTDDDGRTGSHWHDGAAVMQPGAHGSLPFILVPSFRAIDGELLSEHVRPAVELLGRERELLGVVGAQERLDHGDVCLFALCEYADPAAA